jgi:XRE family transcriptional regulator, fatty acid utilization regulator
LSKSFLGPRLRRLREERGLTQVAVAKAVGVSASYYNQLENDQRPLTASLQLRISAAFSIDLQLFAEDDEGRLYASLREAITLSSPKTVVSATELREFAHNHPEIAQAMLTIQQRQRVASERAEALAHTLGARAGEPAPPLSPHEEARDFFYARHNYIGQLDELAERLARELGLAPGESTPRMIAYLQRRHAVRTSVEPAPERSAHKRRYDPDQRLLVLPSQLLPAQRAFQLATQIALLEAPELIHEIAEEGGFSSEEARALARIGLANHFAGALLMPYGVFLDAAERWRYDIDRLRRHFQVSYETTCHRLSTLQRPRKKGVPFFFMRVDRAGNISKRQSATDFHFSRVGGTCPLWNVYEAFTQPGRILRQLAQMPDGRTYLWIARAVTRPSGGFGTPDTSHSIGLGCDLRHASRLVYAQGLDLGNPAAATPIGMGCKVCERRDCLQRAFPPVGHALVISEHESAVEPYTFAERAPRIAPKGGVS